MYGPYCQYIFVGKSIKHHFCHRRNHIQDEAKLVPFPWAWNCNFFTCIHEAIGFPCCNFQFVNIYRNILILYLCFDVSKFHIPTCTWKIPVPSTASQAFIHSRLTAWARQLWRHVHNYMTRACCASFVSMYMARTYCASFISTYRPHAYRVLVISMTPHTLE